MTLPPFESNEKFLVTGSSGFIGARVVDTLLRAGHRNLRCFVRPSSSLKRLDEVLAQHQAKGEVELVTGDLLSPKDCEAAADGVSRIIHLAAGSDKSFAGAFMNSALTTRNLISAFHEKGNPGRFVNVSSFAVYSNKKLPSGGLMDENCALENAFQERNDSYGFGKRKQEEIVQDYGGGELEIPWVILRPGAVFGPGKTDLNGRIVNSTFGFLVQVGGGHRVPLTYVDNCAEAIVMATVKPGIENEIFNVVDDDLPTARKVLKAYKKRTGNRFSVTIPYWSGYLISLFWERYSRFSKGQLPPSFNTRRCAAEWKKKQFSNRLLKERIGWKPRVPIDVAMVRFLDQFGG